MQKLILMAAAFITVGAVTAEARDTYVRGYVRKDGTYVAPHYQSAPNSTTLDNFSTKPNYNPYTGKSGTEDPYALPTYRTYNAPAMPVYRPYSPPPTYKAPCYFNCK